jgi:hypothetical protein
MNNVPIDSNDLILYKKRNIVLVKIKIREAIAWLKKYLIAASVDLGLN